MNKSILVPYLTKGTNWLKMWISLNHKRLEREREEDKIGFKMDNMYVMWSFISIEIFRSRLSIKAMASSLANLQSLLNNILGEDVTGRGVLTCKQEQQ